MPIAVACKCGKKFQAKDELAGKRVKCPGCGDAIAIPAPAAPGKTTAATQSVRPQPAGKPGVAPGSKPAAKAPAKPALDPLSNFDPLGDPLADLGALESAASAMNGPAGFGNPLGTSSLGANPLGGNPLMGSALGAYQQQPARRSSGNNVLWIGIAGGGVTLVVIIGIVLALVMRDKPTAVVNNSQPASPPKQTAANVPANTTSKPAEASVASPAEIPVQVISEATAAPPAPSPTTVETSTTSDLTASSTEPRTSPADDQARPQTSKAAKTWHALGPALQTRLAKPEVLKGANVVGKEPIILAGNSWMLELLPYLGHDDIYQKFDRTKSWTDPKNLQLSGEEIPAFLNPADSRKRWVGHPYDNMSLTHFVGMSGIELSRNDVAALLPRSDPRAGIFGYDAVARINEITDGTSNTLMLIGSGNLAAPWIQAGGGTIRGLREPYFDELTGFGSKGLTEPGALIMMADGSVKTLSAKISPQVFKALCTMHGAEAIDHEQLEAAVK